MYYAIINLAIPGSVSHVEGSAKKSSHLTQSPSPQMHKFYPKKLELLLIKSAKFEFSNLLKK